MIRRLLLTVGMLSVLMATCVAVYADSVSYSPRHGSEQKLSLSPLSTAGQTATSAPGEWKSASAPAARIAEGVTAYTGGGDGKCKKKKATTYTGGGGSGSDSDSDGDSDSDSDSDNGDTDSDGDSDSDSDGDSDGDDCPPPAPSPTPNAPVPEPATMILLGTGLAGVAASVRKRRQAAKE